MPDALHEFARDVIVLTPDQGGQAGADALVWDLTNTHGSRHRTVFMRAANTPFGLELSEFFDVPRTA